MNKVLLSTVSTMAIASSGAFGALAGLANFGDSAAPLLTAGGQRVSAESGLFFYVGSFPTDLEPITGVATPEVVDNILGDFMQFQAGPIDVQFLTEEDAFGGSADVASGLFNAGSIDSRSPYTDSEVAYLVVVDTRLGEGTPNQVLIADLNTRFAPDSVTTEEPIEILLPGNVDLTFVDPSELEIIVGTTGVVEFAGVGQFPGPQLVPVVIPEPSVIALLGLGGLAVFFAVRRRR
jgi:hypothetical protein